MKLPPGTKAHQAPFKVSTPEALQTLVVIGRKDEAVKHFAKERAKALQNGNAIVEADGTRIRHERRPDFTPGAHSPSDFYIWDEAGSRVRCGWYECVTLPSGETQERRFRTVWVDYVDAVS